MPLRRRRHDRSRPKRGRVLAVKLGFNPNSSSLGVDVTFLLVGAAAVSLFTPVVAALLRWRRAPATSGQAPLGPDAADMYRDAIAGSPADTDAAG